MKFVLSNFAKMTAGHMPGINDNLVHRLIRGFVPHYFQLADESADETFRQKINPAYPLVLSPARTILPSRRITFSTAISDVDWQYVGVDLNPAQPNTAPSVVASEAAFEDSSVTSKSVQIDATGADALLVIAMNPAGAAATGATFDGQALSVIETDVDNYFYTVFLLTDPPQAEANVAVTWGTSSNDIAVVAVALSGVDQNDPVRDSAAASGSTSPAELSFTFNPDDRKTLAVAALASLGTGTHTHASTQTQLINDVTGGTHASRFSASKALMTERLVILLPNENDNDLEEFITVTNNRRFTAVDASGSTNLGIPVTTGTANDSMDAVIFNGKLLAAFLNVTRLYHTEIDSTPTWTATTGQELIASRQHILKTLEDRVLVTNGNSTQFASNQIKIVLPDFSVVDGITFEDDIDIVGIESYRNRYALLFARKTESPKVSRHTIAYLWNAVVGDPYDEMYTISGDFLCSAIKDDVVYAFTSLGTTLVCYVFTGAGFQEIGRINNIVIAPQNGPNRKLMVSQEKDFFVFCAATPDSVDTHPFYWNPRTGEAFFLAGEDAGSYHGALVAYDGQDTKRAFLYEDDIVLHTLESATKAASADYDSNFIPAPRVEGIHDDMPMGRMLIKSVTIDYSAPPPSADDIIAFTLTTKDEYESETYGTQTATVKNTTANSTNARVGTTRAILPIGAKATEFAVDLNVTAATASWDLIIRRIVIDYEPIALQP